MKRSSVAWGLAGLGCLFLLVLAGGFAVFLAVKNEGPSKSRSVLASLGGRVGVVDLDGVIVSADRFREMMEKMAEAPNVKAVVLRINSPGGGVAASQEIHRELLRFRRETKKPVVVSMESVAASGGYYAAVASDRIVANPGTITGSIGVILQWVNYGDLLEWAKLRPITFKSGLLKDAGNPTRELTEEEKQYFQQLTERLRGQFRRAVEEGRGAHLKPGTLDRMADGRVVTGDEALELGLVDEIGDYRDAVDRAAHLGGLSLPAEVWHPRPTRPGLIDILSGDNETSSSLAGRLLAGVPVGGGWNVYFLW